MLRNNLVLDLCEYTGENREVTTKKMVIADQIAADRWAAGDRENFYENHPDYIHGLTHWHVNFDYRLKWTEMALAFAKKKNVQTALEFGCGIATDGLSLAELGIVVDLCDIGKKSLDFVRWKIAKYGLHSANIVYSLNKKYDLGTCIDVIGHVKDPVETIQQLAKNCKYLFYTEDFNIGVAAYPMHSEKPIGWDRLMAYLWKPVDTYCYESRIFSPTVCVIPQPPPKFGGVAVAMTNNKKAIERMGYQTIDDPRHALIVHGHAIESHPRMEVYSNHGYYGVQDLDPRVQAAVNPKVDLAVVTARKVIGVSDVAPKLFTKTKPNLKFQVIPNCIDLDEIDRIIPSARGLPYVFWGKANHTHPVFNYDLAKEVVRAMPEMRFIFVAGGTLPQNATVVGKQDRNTIIKWLSGATALLLTGKENDSIMVREAMALGTPIVATPACGMLDYIQHKKTGYIGKTAKDLVKGIQYCCDNLQVLSPQCRTMGRAHNLETYAENLATIYQEVIAENIQECCNPLVSFVVPAYNMEKYLAEAVTSILKQTVQDYEVIIVDDGSTDHTLRIAKKIATENSKVRVIHTKNQGVYNARNTGITDAKGKYICCLDADDKIDRKFVEVLAPILEADRSIGIAYSDFVLFGAQSGRVMVQPANLETIKAGNRIPCCNLFRKSAWEMVGGYKKVEPSWEDYELWLSIIEAGFKVTPVNKPLFHYRKRGEVGRDWESRGFEKQMWTQIHAYHPDLYQPVVSIVIPCYKQAKYLEDSIGSVMRQTLTDPIEIIVVDDGNKDMSVYDAVKELCDKFKVNVDLVQHEQNRGLAEARNSGVVNSHGRYICCLDADDILKPTYLKECVELLESRTDVAIAYTDIEMFGAVGSTRIHELPDYDFDQLTKKNLMHCSAVYRRVVFDAVGGYNPNMVYGWEDYDFWISAGEKGYCGSRIPEPLFMYRRYQGSMIMEAQAHLADMRRQLAENHQLVFKGGRPAMCCGRSMGRSSARNTTPKQVMAATQPLASVQLTQLKYVGHRSATIRGRATGSFYTFVRNEVKYVDSRDTAALLQTKAFVYA